MVLEPPHPVVCTNAIPQECKTEEPNTRKEQHADNLMAKDKCLHSLMHVSLTATLGFINHNLIKVTCNLWGFMWHLIFTNFSLNLGHTLADN